MVCDITQSQPQDWVYLSEGGSTIVFSYTGPFHPDFTDKVLRLRKRPANVAPHVGTAQDEDDLVIAFQNCVIGALVPSKYLADLEVVFLDAAWLATLEALRNGDRPAERRAQDQIDKTRQKGMLATDLIGGADVLAIEIKPKWGFLPNSAHLSQETAGIKASTCRFCMHTHLKYKDSDIPTQYCPLDLYSNDEGRMKKAICDLWDGWVRSNGTLNNMKVFVSGKMIIPSESYASLETFLSATTGAKEALATVLLPLLRTPVLRIISDLQHSLDALDIEGIIKLHAMSSTDGQGLGTGRGNPSLEEFKDFVASYHSVYRSLDHCRLHPELLDTYLVAYLLSATFKDCSLIFRIHRCDVSGSVDSPHAISIIDLDLKGVNRLKQWAELDRRIVEYYRDVAQRKLCFE